MLRNDARGSLIFLKLRRFSSQSGDLQPPDWISRFESDGRPGGKRRHASPISTMLILPRRLWLAERAKVFHDRIDLAFAESHAGHFGMPCQRPTLQHRLEIFRASRTKARAARACELAVRRRGRSRSGSRRSSRRDAVEFPSGRLRPARSSARLISTQARPDRREARENHFWISECLMETRSRAQSDR